MNTAPVYDLCERLRAAAVAGTNLLSEDFRLKRAYEAFRPLESASPVFAKAGQLTGQLLSSDCPNPQGVLLDAISLMDAVLCTLGAVDAAGEPRQPDTISIVKTTASHIINAPCSKVKPLIAALTTSGSGNHALVCDMHVTSPEIFADYRVRHAMIQALGASYSELAETVKEWLKDEDETLIPLLKKGFDSKGKKGMVRRIQLIEKIAGAAENDFYIEMLKTATGEVRAALIEALQHEPSNIEVLLAMEKTEKGKNKQAVLMMLGLMEDERCYELFHKMAAKNLAEVCEYLRPSTTDWASRLIAKLCTDQLSELAALPQGEWGGDTADKMQEKICQGIQTLIGKSGDAVCACYRNLLAHTDILEQAGRRKLNLEILHLNYSDKTGWFNKSMDAYSLTDLTGHRYPMRSREYSWEVRIGVLLARSIAMNADESLKKLALELYENHTDGTKNINFLMAATIVKIQEQEDCMEWLDENAAGQSEVGEMWWAFVCFRWAHRLKSYVVDMSCTQAVGNQVFFRKVFHKVQIPHAKKIKDWMMHHSGESEDVVLNRWVDTTDAAECEKYGKYFYERACRIVNNQEYLRYMRNCGWKQCKGLGTDFAKINIRNDYIGKDVLTYYLHHMPGDEKALMEETSAVVELVRSGQVELMQLDTPEKIDAWAEELKDLSRYSALWDKW